ncbi:MAG TPA: hypothetical protein VIQ26_00540 [Microbacteriaceae bacterium]|jgi:hypothetical protein
MVGEKPPRTDKLTHIIERVNKTLKPAMGPAMIGPLDGNRIPKVGPCPVCGEAMAQHVIEYTGSDAILHCPAGYAVAVELPVKLSMLDMPSLRGGRARAGRR